MKLCTSENDKNAAKISGNFLFQNSEEIFASFLPFSVFLSVGFNAAKIKSSQKK